MKITMRFAPNVSRFARLSLVDEVNRDGEGYLKSIV